MKNKDCISFLIIFFLYSCGYPDVDSVPKFKNMNITMQDSIELCKITKSDIKTESSCYEELNKIINRL